MQNKLDAYIKTQKFFEQSITFKNNKIESDYAETGGLLRKFLKDFVKDKLDKANGTIVFTLFNIQNDFIIRDFHLYTPGAENTAISNMALLDAIIELVKKDPSIAEKIEIITTQITHLNQRSANQKDAQLMAQSTLGLAATNKALAVEKTELQDKKLNEKKYGLNNLCGTIGVAIVAPIEKRLNELTEVKVPVTRVGSFTSSPTKSGMLLQQNLALNNEEFANPEKNIFHESATSFIQYMQDKNYSAVIASGYSLDQLIKECSDDFNILGEQRITVLDPCVHYPMHAGRNYTQARSEAVDLCHSQKIEYFPCNKFRSNPDLILGYKEAIKFHANSALIKQINAIVAVQQEEKSDLFSGLIDIYNTNFKTFIKIDDLSIHKRLLELRISLLRDIQALLSKYPEDNKYKQLVIEYVDLIDTELSLPDILNNIKIEHLAQDALLASSINKETGKTILENSSIEPLLKRSLSTMLFEAFHENKGIIVLTIIDMQNDFLINGFPAYVKGAENAIFSNVALLEALCDLVGNSVEGLISNNRIQIALIKDSNSEYPYYCVPGSNGFNTPSILEGELNRLKNNKVTITEFVREKGGQLSRAKQIKQHYDPLEEMYCEPPITYANFIATNKCSLNIVTGLCQPSSLVEFTQDVATKEQKVTIEDACVFYTVPNTEEYEHSRACLDTAFTEQNKRLGGECVNYLTYCNFRSNHNLIDGYKEAFTFYNKSGLIYTMSAIYNEIDETLLENNDSSATINPIITQLKQDLQNALTNQLLTTNGLSLKERQNNFKTLSLGAIKVAKDALPQESKWQIRLLKLASIIVSLLTLGYANWYTGKNCYSLFGLPKIDLKQREVFEQMEEAIITTLKPSINN